MLAVAVVGRKFSELTPSDKDRVVVLKLLEEKSEDEIMVEMGLAPYCVGRVMALWNNRPWDCEIPIGQYFQKVEVAKKARIETRQRRRARLMHDRALRRRANRKFQLAVWKIGSRCDETGLSDDGEDRE